jgi:NTE family protein
MKLFSKKTNRPKIGLALGSGGSRGLAHIGVIKVLLDNDIPIDYIAGASAGALIGGLYASSKDIDFVERVAREINSSQLMSFVFDITAEGGFSSGNKMEQFIRRELDDITFKDLKLPFAAVATNLETGSTVVLDSGDVTSAIRASISVPLMFEPVRKDLQILVDGGLSEPVPVDLVRAMGADIVIGVNLDAPCSHENHLESVNFKTIAGATMNILRHHLSYMHAKDADVLVEPQFEKQSLIGWEDFLHADGFIAKGQDAMEAALPELKRILSSGQ